MNIAPEKIEALQKLYKRKYGVALSTEEARGHLAMLSGVFKWLVRFAPKTDDGADPVLDGAGSVGSSHASKGPHSPWSPSDEKQLGERV